MLQILVLLFVGITCASTLRNEHFKRDAIVSSEQNVVITSGNSFKVLVNTRDILSEIDSAAASIGALSTTVSSNHDSVLTALAGKADLETTNNALALKADSSVVDAALALKADTSSVTAALALKADSGAVDAALALKADTTAVTDALALKADATFVNDGLAGKADISVVDAALSLKADSASVNDALATKASVSDTYTKSDIDGLLAAKANAATSYTKSQVDTLLIGKADVSTSYTKTQIDGFLLSKADASAVYTRASVDNLLSFKADSSSVYTKSQVDLSLSAKANVATTYTKSEVDTKLGSIDKRTLTLVNSWINQGSTSQGRWATPTAIKDTTGNWVELDGWISGGQCANNAANTHFTDLPAGFAPSGTAGGNGGIMVMAPCANAGCFVAIFVHYTGRVWCNYCTGTGCSVPYFSLSGVRFYVGA